LVCLHLPGISIRAYVDCRQRAPRLTAWRRHEGAAEAERPRSNLVRLAGPDLRLVNAAYIHQVCLRVVRGCGPLRAAVRARAHQDRVSLEGGEDAGSRIVGDVGGACQGNEGIPDRVRLGRRRDLPADLRYLLFVDAYQGLTVSAIEEVHPARLARLAEALHRLPVHLDVEEHVRAGDV